MRTFLIVLILMLGSLPAVASQHHHRYHHITTTYRHHSYRHYAYHHHYGACDGIHRCICGSTQARHFGLPACIMGITCGKPASGAERFRILRHIQAQS
jgi:hypothetical protein